MLSSDLDKSEYGKSVAKFCLAYTYMVMGWNNAEVAAREILTALSKGGIGATIAIHQLGNVSLPEALTTVSKFLRSINNELGNLQADHLDHFVKGMDLLRPHRNFYVHNLRAIHGEPEDATTACGSLFGLDVKGGYSFINHTLSYAQLHDLTLHCLHLKDYGEQIALHVGVGNSLIPQPREPLTSLQKPKWPEKLKRSRSNLITPMSPPPASRA